MKKTACAVALMLCVGLALPLADDPQRPNQPNQGQQQNPSGQQNKKTQDLTVQVVSTDVQTMTITFKDNEGRDQTVPVMKSALESLRKVKAGDRVVVTTQDNESGMHESIIAIRPAKAASGTSQNPGQNPPKE
jgi:hypothetical protein